MGGGISIPGGDHHPDHLKELQEEYAKKKDEINDEATLNSHMTEYYNNSIAKYKKALVTSSTITDEEQRKSRPSSSEVNKKDGDKKTAAPAATAAAATTTPVKSSLPTGKKVGRMEGTRRKSFGQDDVNAKKIAPTPSLVPAAASGDGNKEPTILASASTSGLETTSTVTLSNADSWESVSQQPYCTICSMAFKTPAFLERHIKYSDLHAQTVKKAAETAANTQLADKLKSAQEEGVHYKLLYSGAKFYWRSSENVDFNFYFHVLPDCIEVIPFDVEMNNERTRIYINYTALKTLLKAEIVNQIEKIKLEAASHTPPGDVSKADEDAARICITNYLLNRLQKVSGQDVKFESTASDPVNPTPPIILDKAPSVLIPVQVHRRRRTNAEEVEAAITAVNTSLKSASEATGKATRIVDMMHEGIMMFVRKEKWWDKFNPVRKRWVLAIRKVIRRKLVMDATIHLETMNFTFYAKNPSPMKPKKP